MTVDPSVAGRRYPPTPPYEVGREKIREFAAALGDANPVYVDTAAAQAKGHPEVIAPPTFGSILMLDAWQQVMDDLGVDFSRVLHADQRFVVERPLHAGDLIHAEAVVDDVRERLGASWLVIRTEIRTDADELVASAFSTILVRGADA